MKLQDLVEYYEKYLKRGAKNRAAAKLTPEERHDLARFLFFWLSGEYMGKYEKQGEALKYWTWFKELFPPKVSGEVPLYRVVTIPQRYADSRILHFNPAPGHLSSWTSTKTGTRAVADIATELSPFRDTARVIIKAMIPAENIMATPKTIRHGFYALTHDYWDRFPEWSDAQPDPDDPRRIIHSSGFKNWPDEDARFSMHDIDYLHDMLTHPGGYQQQYEFVVRTPTDVVARVVKILRRGEDESGYWDY